jgi:hypothetical protein
VFTSRPASRVLPRPDTSPRILFVL